MEQILVFPQFEDLKNEVEKMRTELSMFVLERDELRFVECKNIEMSYMLKLGSLEYKVYEAQCSFLRLKRKSELIQVKINRQEVINVKTIDAVLDREFAEYQEKLNKQLEKMNAAIDRSKSKLLSAEETRELKQLYRKIIKALHPDLHQGLSSAQQGLFRRAVNAYENGDLNTLRIIDETVSDPVLPDIGEDAMASFVKEHKRLKELIESVKKSIEKIKSEYPYTLREILQDEEKIETRKVALKEILSQYEEAIKTYIQRIEELLR